MSFPAASPFADARPRARGVLRQGGYIIPRSTGSFFWSAFLTPASQSRRPFIGGLHPLSFEILISDLKLFPLMISLFFFLYSGNRVTLCTSPPQKPLEIIWNKSTVNPNTSARVLCQGVWSPGRGGGYVLCCSYLGIMPLCFESCSLFFKPACLVVREIPPIRNFINMLCPASITRFLFSVLVRSLLKHM